jgi:acetyltransferase-like isoleucine patch superfamily enzyme
MRIQKESITFRLLKKYGIIGNRERYGEISLLGLFNLFFSTLFKRILFNYAYKAYILEPLHKKNIRPAIWRLLGCDVGKNVHIGHNVRLDFGNTKLIHVGDDVVLSNGVTILCHRRDVSNYTQGQKATKLPFVYEDVTLDDGCQIGLNTTILPGVTIGEGSIIGSCSVVTKSIPAWSIAVGNPAKVIRQIPQE